MLKYLFYTLFFYFHRDFLRCIEQICTIHKYKLTMFFNVLKNRFNRGLFKFKREFLILCIYGIVCIPAAGKNNIKQKIFPMKSEKVLIIADGAAFGPQMNDIYRLMQEGSAKFSLYLPESLEWLLLKADLLGQPDILEILEHPADFIESSEFFSWERFFTNLLEQRTKDISYMRYDKAKLPEFYLQEENLEKIIAEME